MKPFRLKKLVFRSFLCVLIMTCIASMHLVADIEDTIHRSFNVAKGGKLTMDVDGASIEIITTKSDVVKVRVVRKAKTSSKSRADRIFDDYKIKFNQSGNDVFIETNHKRRKRGLFSWFRDRKIRVRFTITLPEKYHLDLYTSGGRISVNDIEGNIKVRTSGGRLNFENVKGKLWGKTSGGSIGLKDCTGPVEVKTSGGSISIGRVSGEVKAHTSGGGISVEEVMGTINATTSGGSVSAYISQQPKADCSLRTSGGTIKVKLAEGLRMNIDAKTSGGRVRTEFPVTVKGEISKKRLQAKINGGGPELYLRTSGGGIKIHKID